MVDVKEILSKSEERMEMAAMFLEDELNRIRAGRANVAILDGVRVERIVLGSGLAHAHGVCKDIVHPLAVKKRVGKVRHRDIPYLVAAEYYLIHFAGVGKIRYLKPFQLLGEDFTFLPAFEVFPPHRYGMAQTVAVDRIFVEIPLVGFIRRRIGNEVHVMSHLTEYQVQSI